MDFKPALSASPLCAHLQHAQKNPRDKGVVHEFTHIGRTKDDKENFFSSHQSSKKKVGGVGSKKNCKNSRELDEQRLNPTDGQGTNHRFSEGSC